MAAEIWNNSIVHEAGTFFKCLKCGTKSRLYNEAKTAIFTCPNCGKIYSKTNDVYNGLKPVNANKLAYCLPIYSKCKFDDTEYTVVGAASKYEKGNRSGKWQEYILLDKAGRYAFLNVSYGHWVILRERTQPQDFNQKHNSSFQNDDGREYRIYSSYYHVTQTCIGEFPYDVIDVKERYSKEFICPPFIFTYEHCRGEKSFFEGIYKKPKEIIKAFAGQNLTLPVREGTGSCQPTFPGFNHTNFLKLTILFFLVAFLLYKGATYDREPIQLASSQVQLYDTIKATKTITPSFTLSNTTLLRCYSRASVNNDWVEINVTLVNEKTGAEKSFVMGLEFYTGYDDGYWSEGSQEGTSYINNLPAGTYHAAIEVLGSEKTDARVVDVSLFEDYPTSRNFWLLMCIMGGISIIIYYIGNKLENQRGGILTNE